MNWRRELGIGATCFVAGLVVAAGICVWMKYKPSLPAVLGQPADPVASVPSETMPCTSVQALAPKAKKKLGLPVQIQKDEQASVLTAVDVPRTDHPQIATALLHRDTGVGEIYFTPQPLPWLAFNRRATLGIAYGFKNDHAGTVANVYGKLELLQIKALHTGLMGDLDTTGDWVAKVYGEASWNWKR